MTIQQEAYSLIGALSDQNVRIVVEFIRNLPKDAIPDSTANAAPDRKAVAFSRLQELRKEISACQPGSLGEERASMAEKYNAPLICRHSVLCTGKR